MSIADVASAFLLGIATPLTAVCVIPLYPAFLSYLANQLGEDDAEGRMLYLGGLVVAGVIAFMLLAGLLVSTVLQASLSGFIGTVSPVAFGLLAVMGLVLLADVDVGAVMPSVDAPRFEDPRLNAFGFGFFFGLIVLPCNPAFIGALFARSLLVADPVLNILRFLAFGVGMGFPLLLFAAVSEQRSSTVIGFLTRYRTWINRVSGAVMLAVAVYYLVVVFRVVP